MKQIYRITPPTGKTYIGKDSIGSYRYYGSPDINVVNADFARPPETTRRTDRIRKEIPWESPNCTESELSTQEVEFIRKFESNNPAIGYNRWPKFQQD
ncbi:GIY-YIG nuclease family protein [Guyparkeria sp.]|uniref:GIY-YIG nuclease family protein n=1 Tax=Guyparkeria sp. TaxID=2035736 RepID=UPI003970B74B